MQFKGKIDITSIPKKYIDEMAEFIKLTEGYSDFCKHHIYTNIQTVSGLSEPQQKQTLIQLLISKIVLRSLYLNEALINEFNQKNAFGIFCILKSFVEIPALLGYLLYLLEEIGNYGDFKEKIRKIHLGEKGDGDLRIGNIEATNVLTMFDKMIEVFDKIYPEKKHPGDVCFDFYKSICNYGHPNFSAHYFIGNGIGDTYSIYKENEYDNLFYKQNGLYTPAWDTSILLIEFLITKITQNPSINNFNEIKTERYFSV